MIPETPVLTPVLTPLTTLKLFAIAIAVKVEKAEYWQGREHPIQEFDAIALAVTVPDTESAEAAVAAAVEQLEEAQATRGLIAGRDYFVVDQTVFEVPTNLLREIFAADDPSSAAPSSAAPSSAAPAQLVRSTYDEEAFQQELEAIANRSW